MWQRGTSPLLRPLSRYIEGVATKADEWDKVQRFCRYNARPTVFEQRLSLTAQGLLR
jgi:hypothetical protein